jgi:hypothetical protein
VEKFSSDVCLGRRTSGQRDLSLEIRGVASKFNSENWKLQNPIPNLANRTEAATLVLASESQKVSLKCLNVLNLPNQCLGVAVKNEQIYFQTSDLNLFRQPVTPARVGPPK